MDVHQKLMIGFAVIAERMLKDNRDSEEPEHPTKIMVNAMNCLLANEFEGETVDETFQTFKSADEEKKTEMFEMALHFVGMSIAHLDAFIEKFIDEEDDESKQDDIQNAVAELKDILDNTGLSLN